MYVPEMRATSLVCGYHLMANKIILFLKIVMSISVMRTPR